MTEQEIGIIITICDPKSENQAYGNQNFRSTVSVQPARTR